jgi:hypothetical protein
VSKPFAGVRILDFTRYLAGPYGTYQLALLGDPIIHLEVGTREYVRGQELAGAKNWRRLERRLRQGRRGDDPETHPHHGHRREGGPDTSGTYHKSPPCAAIIDSACGIGAFRDA